MLVLDIIESHKQLVLITLLTLLCVSFVYFLYLYILRFFKLTGYKNSHLQEVDYPNITVILVVVDQIDYLKTNLDIILNQEYPTDYNVVIVNDKPETEEVVGFLNQCNDKYGGKLYITTIPKDGSFKHTKKLAYTIGVKAAKYNHIIFSDPKSQIKSTLWLRKMAAAYVKGDVVVGYADIKKSKGFANGVFRAVNIYDSLMSLTSVVNGHPYRATMLNMGYTSELFFKVGGYRKHLRLNSGENDLFLQRLSEKSRVSMALSVDATVLRNYNDHTFGRWFKNQVFDSYTVRYFDAATCWYLFLNPLFSLLFWLILPLVLVLDLTLWPYILGGVVLREAIISLILYRFSKRTGSEIPYFKYLLFDILCPVYKIILYLNRKFNPSCDLWI